MNLSFVICCYRGEDTIHECLTSVCNQNYDKTLYEIIIVDDGSIGDTSQEIETFIDNRVEKLPLIKYYKKVNEGLSIARNFGASKASGEFVSYIDEDAKADENFVLEAVRTFKENPRVNCLGGQVNIWNTNDYFARLYHYSLFNWRMTEYDAIIGTNMSFRKSLLKKTGGFQKEFSRRGDEMFFFVKAGKFIKKFVSKKVIIFHNQPNSKEHYINTRYENGCNGALTLIMGYNKYGVTMSSIFIKTIWHFLFVSLPFLILISIFVNLQLLFFLLAIFLLLFVIRYLIQGHLRGPISYLSNSPIETKLQDYIRLTIVILKGFWKEDIGFMKTILSVKKIKSELKLKNE